MARRAKKAAGTKPRTPRQASARARRAKLARSKRARSASTSSRRQTATSARRAAPAPGARHAKRSSALGFLNQHMDYTSHSMEDVKRFYTELLGFDDFDFDPKVQYLRVRTGASSSVGFMPPAPGPPEQWRPPREPAIYLEVLDVDRAHRELVARGVAFQQPPMDMPWNHRVAILRDPEGRTIMLAQRIAAGRVRGR